MMYKIVDDFLQEEYQESYNDWKAISSKNPTGQELEIKEEEKIEAKKY